MDSTWRMLSPVRIRLLELRRVERRAATLALHNMEDDLAAFDIHGKKELPRTDGDEYRSYICGLAGFQNSDGLPGPDIIIPALDIVVSIDRDIGPGSLGITSGAIFVGDDYLKGACRQGSECKDCHRKTQGKESSHGVLLWVAGWSGIGPACRQFRLLSSVVSFPALVDKMKEDRKRILMLFLNERSKGRNHQKIGRRQNIWQNRQTASLLLRCLLALAENRYVHAPRQLKPEDGNTMDAAESGRNGPIEPDLLS